MILQSAIPEGPAWAVAIFLVGGIIVAIGHVAVKLVKTSRGNGNGNGHRAGTRRTDDTKLSRAEIEREVDMTRTIADTYDMLDGLVKSQQVEVVARAEHRNNIEKMFERMSVTTEATQRSNELNSGILSIMVQHIEEIRVRTQHLATSAELKAEGTSIRHDWRNALAPLGFKIAPLKEGP